MVIVMMMMLTPIVAILLIVFVATAKLIVGKIHLMMIKIMLRVVLMIMARY